MAAGCVKLKMFKAKWAPVLNVEYQSMAEAWAVHKHHHLPDWTQWDSCCHAFQAGSPFLPKSLCSSGQETHIAT